MNLYLIERTDEIGYDEWDAYVVAAHSEKLALEMARWNAIVDSPPTCKLIGTPAAGIAQGVILGSFNAG